VSTVCARICRARIGAGDHWVTKRERRKKKEEGEKKKAVPVNVNFRMSTRADLSLRQLRRLKLVIKEPEDRGRRGEERPFVVATSATRSFSADQPTPRPRLSGDRPPEEKKRKKMLSSGGQEYIYISAHRCSCQRIDRRRAGKGKESRSR